MFFPPLGPPRPRPRPHPKKSSRRPLQVLQLLRRKEQTHLQQMHLQRQHQLIPNHEFKTFFSPTTHIPLRFLRFKNFTQKKRKRKPIAVCSARRLIDLIRHISRRRGRKQRVVKNSHQRKREEGREGGTLP